MLKRPWPGMLRTLYGDDQRYVETYWSRFGPRTYLVGDAPIRDKDGGDATTLRDPAVMAELERKVAAAWSAED